MDVLPESDREAVELESRRSASPVGIAAIVCAALQRMADQVGDPDLQRVVQSFAARHTSRMAAEIGHWADRRGEKPADTFRRPPRQRGPSIREVREPDVAAAAEGQE